MDKTSQIVLRPFSVLSLIIVAAYFCVFCGLEDSSMISSLLFYSSILLLIIQAFISLYFFYNFRVTQDFPIETPKHVSYYEPKHSIPNYFIQQKPVVKEPIMAVAN